MASAGFQAQDLVFQRLKGAGCDQVGFGQGTSLFCRCRKILGGGQQGCAWALRFQREDFIFRRASWTLSSRILAFKVCWILCCQLCCVHKLRQFRSSQVFGQELFGPARHFHRAAFTIFLPCLSLLVNIFLAGQTLFRCDVDNFVSEFDDIFIHFPDQFLEQGFGSSAFSIMVLMFAEMMRLIRV
jgi:hypothetical protein